MSSVRSDHCLADGRGADCLEKIATGCATPGRFEGD